MSTDRTNRARNTLRAAVRAVTVRTVSSIALAALAYLAAVPAAAGAQALGVAQSPGVAEAMVVARRSIGPVAFIPDSLRGRSGQLRAKIIRPRDLDALRADSLTSLLGDAAFKRPSIWSLADSLGGELFHFITLVPFESKQNGKVGVYRVGRWPAESGRLLNAAYRLPAGFIEVTPENQETQVSSHFRLRDFLTKDQATVWPKALVLDERLLDKLELIVAELRLAGHKAPGLAVMSGFRTPQYNARGGRAGRASNSRHQYGDAADVFVDADGDGRMDDLNGDGKVNLLDAQAFLKLVERVERKYPELTGGAGLYRATSSHGPYVHVDARGERIRW